MSKILLPSDMSLPYDKDFYQDYGVFVKPINYPMSQRKLEALLAISEMQRYFQCNPIKWIDLMYNIELLDLQALFVQRSWNCPNVLTVASRGIGKSTVIDLEVMSKDSLFCNYWCYIASGSGDQAQQTFTTLERLANDNIDEFSGSTGKLFKDEIVINNAAGDGFSHGASGFSYETYNGSYTRTLNSNIDRKRGQRGSVVFDECGFLSEEMINVYGAFTIVNKNLKTGKDAAGRSLDPIRQRTFASNIPNQKFMVSSASSTDTAFYKTFRDWSKKQIEGDPDFCVMMFDCNLAFKPTIRNEVIAPLLMKSTVDSELRKNPEKARREYFCTFSVDAGADAAFKRGAIIRNEVVTKPLLYNDTGDKHFVICYDPARQRDNSFILIGEIYEAPTANGETELRGRLVNGINLIDIERKLKKPMRTPEQMERLKKVILDYNAGADAYGNIELYIDAGSGGGGVNVGDYLMADWTDETGETHRGLIDKEYSADYVKDFPNAIDKVHLMSPSKYKSEMFEAAAEMVNLDKIDFPASYDGKGYLTVFDVDENLLKAEKAKIEARLKKKNLSESEMKEAVKEELNKVQSVKTKMIKLDWEEDAALASIDALKEELVNIVRKKGTAKDSFDLSPEKSKTLNDDRAYCFAMFGYALSEARRKRNLKKPKNGNKDLLNKLAGHIKKSSILT